MFEADIIVEINVNTSGKAKLETNIVFVILVFAILGPVLD